MRRNGEEPVEIVSEMPHFNCIEGDVGHDGKKSSKFVKRSPSERNSYVHQSRMAELDCLQKKGT